MINVFDINKASLDELINEHHECELLWSTHSCDCLSLYMTSIEHMIAIKQNMDTTT